MIMATDIKTNKVKNEEFKIWKKSVPSLYEHIACLQPSFNSEIEEKGGISPFNTVLFNQSISEFSEKGLVSTSLYYSQGSNIYEIKVQLPLGTYKVVDTGQLSQPQYDGSCFGQPDSPKWVFEGETIIKMEIYSSMLIALSTTGKLAWFDSSSKNPIKVSASEVASTEEQSSSVFDISSDGKYVILSESGKAVTKVSIIDNKEKLGQILRVITVAGTKRVLDIKFHTTTLFSAVCDDNVQKFWDVRGTDDEPLLLFYPNKANSSSSYGNETEDSDNVGEDEGNLSAIEVSKIFDTLFITGSDTGVIKLWDLRSITASNAREVKEANDIVTFYQIENDPVVGIQFSTLDPQCFVTVGKSSNVYHWDITYLINEAGTHENAEEHEGISQGDLQEHCLKFLHTGGGRRSASTPENPVLLKSSVTIHPQIRDIVGTVDGDGFLTVYKGFYGRKDDAVESE